MIRSITWLVRLLYLPLFLLVGNGVAIYLVTEGFNHGWLVFLILVFIGISFATEKLTPYDREFNEPQQDRRRVKKVAARRRPGPPGLPVVCLGPRQCVTATLK